MNSGDPIDPIDPADLDDELTIWACPGVLDDPARADLGPIAVLIGVSPAGSSSALKAATAVGSVVAANVSSGSGSCCAVAVFFLSDFGLTL